MSIFPMKINTAIHKKSMQLFFSVAVLVSILILTFFTLFSAVSYIKNEKKSEFINTVNINVNSLEKEIEQSERAINYLSSNHTLHEFLKLSSKDYISRIEQSKIAGSLIYNTLLSNQSFKRIKVYSSEEIAKYSDLLFYANDVGDEQWYKNAISTDEPYWFMENGKIFLSKVITNEYPREILGVVKVQVVDDFFTNEFSVFAGKRVRITIENSLGVVFSEYNSVLEEKTYSVERILSDGNWRITYDCFFEDSFDIYLKSLVFPVVICLLVLFMTCLLIVKLNREEKIKRDIELELLRSKINPHFLYNNLSAINWIAIEKNEKRIYDISTGLAAFYRTALNHGKNIDTLNIEFENIRAYLKLQQCAHDNRISVMIEEPESSKEWYTPIFIIQPIIENAIEHGIDTLDDREGEISIKAYKNADVITIEIKDNGQSLYRSLGTEKMPYEMYGYGLKNVDSRIKLICNGKHGVEITADETGTTARVIYDEMLVRKSIEE